MKAIPKTMTAAVVENFRQPLQIRDVPVFSHGFTQMNTDCPWHKKVIRVNPFIYG